MKCCTERHPSHPDHIYLLWWWPLRVLSRPNYAANEVLFFVMFGLSLRCVCSGWLNPSHVDPCPLESHDDFVFPSDKTALRLAPTVARSMEKGEIQQANAWNIIRRSQDEIRKRPTRSDATASDQQSCQTKPDQARPRCAVRCSDGPVQKTDHRGKRRVKPQNCKLKSTARPTE